MQSLLHNWFIFFSRTGLWMSISARDIHCKQWSVVVIPDDSSCQKILPFPLTICQTMEHDGSFYLFVLVTFVEIFVYFTTRRGHLSSTSISPHWGGRIDPKAESVKGVYANSASKGSKNFCNRASCTAPDVQYKWIMHGWDLLGILSSIKDDSSKVWSLSIHHSLFWLFQAPWQHGHHGVRPGRGRSLHRAIPRHRPTAPVQGFSESKLFQFV